MPRATAAKLLKGMKAMKGGASASCPPGVWCMDTSTMLVCILCVVAIAAIAIFMMREFGAFREKPRPYVEKEPKVIVINKEARQAPANVVMNPDPRFAPLSPEQSYGRMPDLQGFPTRPMAAGMGALPINVQTRGIPDQFQQMGVLTTPGGTETSATPNRTILPLFGRAIDTARNRWNYYTRTDGMNPVQVPVQFKRQNCEDDTGCDEVINGDSVGVPIMGQSFTASIYRYSTPRYLPVV